LVGDELLDSVALEAKTKSLSASGVRYISIDLSPLDYVYSDAINRFIGMNRSLLSAAGRLVIVAPHPKVFEILNRAGVDKQVKVVRSIEELQALSDILLRGVPDMNAPKSAAKPQDDFSDLKQILSDTLTIGDDSFQGNVAASQPTPAPQPVPVSQPSAPKTVVEPNYDDNMFEVPAKQQEKPSEPPKSAPVKKNADFVVSQEIEFDFSQEEEPVKSQTQAIPVHEAPKARVQEQPAPVAPQQRVSTPQSTSIPTPKAAPTTKEFVYSKSGDTVKVKGNETAYTHDYGEKKKTDVVKIILVLLIVLLIVFLAGFITGIFPTDFPLRLETTQADAPVSVSREDQKIESQEVQRVEQQYVSEEVKTEQSASVEVRQKTQPAPTKSQQQAAPASSGSASLSRR
jgi:anti-anti-sigma regulatory factor